MSSKPTLGIVLPSQRLPHEAERDLSSDLRRAAAAAADAGAETIWVWDHMLKAPVYQDSWHDPLISLASVADFGIRLGTGVLVAPVRAPVQTAAAVATLQALSGHPMRLGIGTGWNPTEFAAAGVRLQRRGSVTDEFLSVLESIFAGRSDFSGRYWTYQGLDIGYHGDPPEIWIAGGSRAAGGGNLGSQEKQTTARIADTVVGRIIRHGRWILRPTAEFTDYQRDVQALTAAAGAEAISRIQTSTILVGHIVETDDPQLARQQQYPVFAQQLVSDKRTPQYLDQRYLLGSLAEIRRRVETWIGAGLEHLALYLLGDVPAQVSLARQHLSDLWTEV